MTKIMRLFIYYASHHHHMCAESKARTGAQDGTALKTSGIQTCCANVRGSFSRQRGSRGDPGLRSAGIVFFPATLAAQAKQFIDGFSGEVAYAVKANPCPKVITVLAQAGVEVFDVASTMEMETIARTCPGPELDL